eukprot:gene25307-11100_t
MVVVDIGPAEQAETSSKSDSIGEDTVLGVVGAGVIIAGLLFGVVVVCTIRSRQQEQGKKVLM